MSEGTHRDILLALWMILSGLLDILVFGVCAYAVFWLHRDPWWFLLILLLMPTPTLHQALNKRFGLPCEDSDDE
jgi:hypothetical protein